MNRKAWARQGPLPAGLDRETGAVLTLARCRARPGSVADPASLTPAQQVALVEARWRAGAWEDIIYGTEGEVDLERAVAALHAGSEMGRHLLAIGLRAIEMAHEDAAAGAAGKG